MSDGAYAIYDLAKTTAEQIGTDVLASGAKAVANSLVAWVRSILPGHAQAKLAAVEAAPASAKAKDQLAGAITDVLEAKPALAAELRGLLAEAGATTQTVGDHGRGVLIKGSNNEVKMG